MTCWATRESSIKGQVPERRAAAHREHARPLRDQLKAFLDTSLRRISGKSTLAEASTSIPPWFALWPRTAIATYWRSVEVGEVTASRRFGPRAALSSTRVAPARPDAVCTPPSTTAWLSGSAPRPVTVRPRMAAGMLP